MSLAEYLSHRHISFRLVPHPETHAANRMAAVLHLPGREVAKTVMLRADRGYVYVVAVLPADCRVDTLMVSQMLGGCEINLATEREICERCPDCERGVLPPFGSLYGMRTIVDTRLARCDEITFEGETHHEAITMSFGDFRRTEEPLIGDFARRASERL
ncbi:MAG: YbaK/EbsC family protein [Pirellulaceae bacterium]|nr:YbaK/EbsC family protein [Planctomycetales bacterium]